MSLEVVKQEITRFLSAATPEVLCVVGKWGVGKTYSWKTFAAEAAAMGPGGVALERYAYVSLFGLNSLDELKYAVFENTTKREGIGVGPSFQSLQEMSDAIIGWARKSGWILNLIPKAKGLFSAAAPAFFLTVRNQVICFDDLERKGKGLAAGDVLGLASFLKEERKCKIIFLLNDDALQTEDRQKFDDYLEKVVDVRLKFAPSSTESLQIGLPGNDQQSNLIREQCSALGITNLRTIKRIENFVTRLARPLAGLEERVYRQMIHSVVLFVWSTSEPGAGPPLSYLRRLTDFGLLFSEAVAAKKDGTNKDETKQRWDTLLRRYNFGTPDAFDLALMDSIEKGFFDEAAIRTTATELNAQAIAEKHQENMRKAWSLYHDSFDHNADEVVLAIEQAFNTSLNFITPGALSATVALFKSLNHSQRAAEMLSRFMKERIADRSFYDLAEHPFGGEISDPDVRAAFAAKLAQFEKPTRDPGAILLKIGKDRSWGKEDMASLAALSKEQFVTLFKTHRGDTLHDIITGVLGLGNIVNPDDQMTTVVRNARTALQDIADENELNARRVSKYGISRLQAED